MKSVNHIIMLCIFLWISPAFASKSITQLQEASTTSTSYVEAETYKAVERELVQTLVAEHHSQYITKAIKAKAGSTMKRISKAMAGMNRSERVAFLKKLTHRSKDGLKKLVKMSQGSMAHYLSVLKNSKSVASLKAVVAGHGDKAGSWVLKRVADIDSVMAKGGKVSKDALKRLVEGAKGLPPKRAKAFLDMVSKKMTTDWRDIAKGGDSAASVVGTVVDGVFVLNDAYNIYYIDDPEKKAVKASAKIIEYGTSTTAAVAVGAVEGATTTALGGFLPGLVIALSANRVGTLYDEMMMLQKERADAKSALRNEKIDNGILVRRQLIKVSHLIEKGELEKAEHLLHQVDKWSMLRRIDNASKLREIRSALAKDIKKYKRREEINRIINRARFPYREAVNYYREGRELMYARKLAIKSRQILKENLTKYPEIAELKALAYIERLIAAINAKLANVMPLQIVRVAGAKEVFAGEVEHYTLTVRGGVPDYVPVGIDGYGTKDSVTIYWQAPEKLGKKSLNFKVKDSMGTIATTSISVNVIAKEKEVKAIKLIAYTAVWVKGEHEIMPGIKAQNSVNVEAHDVYPGDDIYFVLNVDKSDYTYKWTVNGQAKQGKRGYALVLTAQNEPNFKRDEIGTGVNTISVTVYDKAGVRIGSDSWTVYVKDTSHDGYLLSPIIPDGDDD